MSGGNNLDVEMQTFKQLKGYQTLSKLISTTSNSYRQNTATSNLLNLTSHLGMNKCDQSISPLPERSLQMACKVLLETFKIGSLVSTENAVFVVIAASKCLNPMIERLNSLLKIDEAYNQLNRIGSNSTTANPANKNSSSNHQLNYSSNYDDLIADIICILTTIIDHRFN